jgi:hypothetical protein
MLISGATYNSGKNLSGFAAFGLVRVYFVQIG